MTRRYVYLLLTFIFMYFGSLMLQSSVSHPDGAVASAKEFKQVNLSFCIQNRVGTRWSISVNGGAIPKGSIGLLSSARQKLVAGDCLSARLQLSEVAGFSRFAFKGTLKELNGPISHSKNLEIVNSMKAFAASFSGDAPNLVAGLAIGVDEGLSKQFLVNMKATGLTHLTAVSGANCAIVLGTFWLLFRLLRMARFVRFVGSLSALCAYVTLVGPQPSVLRAAFMLSVVLFAFEFGRRVWVPGALILGSLILLVLDPWLVIDLGFWLSVLATFGLVLLTPSLAFKFEKHMPKPLAIGLAATLAAQIWCLPILIELQGGITTYSVLANLLVEPVVPVITVLGLLATVLAAIWTPLGIGIFSIASIPAGWIVWVPNSLSQAPTGLLAFPNGWLGVLIAAFVVLAITFALLRQSFLSVVLIALVAFVWIGGQLVSVARVWPIPGWQIVGCDVGQGDSLVIRSQGQTAVIDVGKDPELIDHCLDRLGVETINLLVLTHFDNDHVGGLAGAERGRKVGMTLISPYLDERPAAQFLKEELGHTSEQVIAATLGQSGSFGDYSWQVFSSLGTQAHSANQGSLGIRFESKTNRIFTLADLDAEAQSLALDWATASSKSTIVKVSHHGSADQFAEFYNQINADVAMISVGAGNSYGHPTKKIMDILRQCGTRVFRTDLEGSISLRVDNGSIEALVAGAR